MSKRTVHFIAAAGVSAGIAAAIWIGRDAAREEEPRMVQRPTAELDLAQPQPQSPTATSMPAAPAADRTAPQPVTDQSAQEFERRAQFQQHVRAFFAQAPALPPAERSSRGQSIAQEITEYEAAGEIAAAEALTLRAALIRETVDDPAEQVEAMAALQEYYRQQGRRKQAEWEARVDPEFELYKAREREIVAEVRAMAQIPGGLTRDEYLRRRLQSAREQSN